VQAKQPTESDKVTREKVKILENEKNGASRNYAHQEKSFARSALMPFNVNSGGIINADGGKEDEYIRRYESHVENTTGNQQQKNPMPLRQQKVGSHHGGKKDSKFE
jgi:hypothetical protein